MQCRFGVTFAQIDRSRSVVGVVQGDCKSPSSRHRRRYRDERTRRVSGEDISRAIDTVLDIGPGVATDLQRATAAAMDLMSKDPEFHRAVATQLRADLDETLGQSHDFIQLVKLVRGHAETLLVLKHPDLLPVEAAEKAETEGSIYFATELLLLKMDSLAFIKEPNLAIGSAKRFRIHPFILKYVRIYKWQAQQKEVDIQLGQCYAQCAYNDQAIGAIIQSLLDNMYKYAPAGSKADIIFEENGDEITILFESLGPKIDPDEFDSIFVQGKRARAAREVERNGMGVGLATVRAVSDVLGLRLSVSQDPQEDSSFPARFATRFSVTLRRA